MGILYLVFILNNLNPDVTMARLSEEERRLRHEMILHLENATVLWPINGADPILN
jgi:hypothetical protein